MTLNFVTRRLPHTALSHHLSHNFVTTIFDTRLCHTPSFTHTHTIFDIPSFTHHRCPTPFLTHLCHTPLCITPSFTHHFVTHHLSSFTHNFVADQLCHTLPFTHNFHTPSFTYNLVTHTTLFYFSTILHHLLCLSFFPRPRYNIWCSLLEEVALWGYPVLEFFAEYLSGYASRKVADELWGLKWVNRLVNNGIVPEKIGDFDSNYLGKL